jgi:thiamine biosynthesis lipoprotein
MGESRRFSVLSAGAFDISVQLLWRLYAHFWSRTAVQDDVLARARDVARDLVDFRAIDIGSARIAFARDGMAVTLNSLAQGYITDAAADLLRDEGYTTAFVDLGEIRALAAIPMGGIGGSASATPRLRQAWRKPSASRTPPWRCRAATAPPSSPPGGSTTSTIPTPGKAPTASSMRP